MREQPKNAGWLKWLLVALTLLTLAACSSQPPQPTGREPIIPATTKIPDQATRDALTAFDLTTGVMRFSAATPLLDSLKADDVLVSEPAKAAPFGFLRKVKSVRKEGAEVVVETTEAKLTDAVQQGTLEVEGQVAANQLQQVTPLSEGAYGRAGDATEDTGGLSPQVTFGKGFNFEAGVDTVLKAQGDNGNATVTFKGLVRFNVGYRIYIDIGFLADLNTVEASLGFDEETTIDVNADAVGTIQKEIQAARFDFSPVVFFIGPVPVVLVLSAVVVVGIDGKATLHFDYKFSQSGGFTQGVRWNEDDGWQRINKNGFDVKQVGPNFKGTMDMRAYARGDLRVLAYGVVGPAVGLTAGVRLDVAVPRDPYWILSGFVKGDVAFVIDLLGEDERFSAELFNTEKQIASGAAKPPTITILNPNPTVDLGLKTDLSQFFRIDDDTGATYTLSSDRDGPLSSTYSFASAGVRTVTVTARGASGKDAQAFFTANVVNTPPDPPALADETNLSVGEGDEFDLNLNGLPTDKNSGTLPCSAVRWTVLGSDALVTEAGSSSGCNATAVFSQQGTRTVTATVTDPQGLTSERTFNITVGAPPAVKSPSIGFINVVAYANKNYKYPFPYGGTVDVNPDYKPPVVVPLTASVTIVNPDNVDISYEWEIVNKNGYGNTERNIGLETTSVTVNVGETAVFTDPGGSLVTEPICLNGDEEVQGHDEATFRLAITAAGRTRYKTFDFRCKRYSTPVK